MAVNITFECDGKQVTEANALDFGTVQAGTSSAMKVITIKNTGDSDAMQCRIDPVLAVIANGFSSDAIQKGTDRETKLAQWFANAGAVGGSSVISRNDSMLANV